MRRPPILSLESVETILEYSFRDHRILEEALLAPSRVHNEETGNEIRHHGNRSLSVVGQHLLAVIIANSARQHGFAPRKNDRGERSLWLILVNIEDMNKAIAEVQKVKAIEDAARSAGVDHWIEPCVRQDRDIPSANTVRSAVFAIIAAVWQDCHHDFETTCSAFEKLGINVDRLLHDYQQIEQQNAVMIDREQAGHR